MTDLAISTFDMIAAGNMRRPSFGKRIALWIETNQKAKAEREIEKVLRRVRN